MIGRAELETDIQSKELFESVNPLKIYPWASAEAASLNGYNEETMVDRDNYYNGRIPEYLRHRFTEARKDDTGMIIAERGSGKTFFARKLAAEIPSTLYILDKRTLEYRALERSQEPRLVLADDIHYLSQAMRFFNLSGSPLTTEERVLDNLKAVKSEARENGAKLVFLSDEGPAGLSHNFMNDRNRKTFAEILNGCVSVPEDAMMFNKLLGTRYSGHRSPGILYLRDTILSGMAKRLKKEFDMTDIPPRILADPLESYSASIKRIEFLLKGAIHDRTQARNRGISWKLEEKTEEIRSLSRRMSSLRKQKVGYLVSSTEDWLLTGNFSLRGGRVGKGREVSSDVLDLPLTIRSEIDGSMADRNLRLDLDEFRTVPIAPIRMLTVLNDHLGGVNRQTLLSAPEFPAGLHYGRRVGQGTYVYSHGSVGGIREIISNGYFYLTRRESPHFANEIFLAPTETEARLAFLKRELVKE